MKDNIRINFKPTGTAKKIERILLVDETIKKSDNTFSVSLHIKCIYQTRCIIDLIHIADASMFIVHQNRVVAYQQHHQHYLHQKIS